MEKLKNYRRKIKRTFKEFIKIHRIGITEIMTAYIYSVSRNTTILN